MLHPQFILPIATELVVDLFAGGGGASTGFKALPAPAGKQWHDVLGVPSTASSDDINAAYRRLASEAHPDKGGSAERMAEINKARDAALQQVPA